MILRQIRSTDGTGTLSYLLVDEETHQAMVIDPNASDTQRIALLARELQATIRLVVDTHTHVDHVSAAGALQRLCGAALVMHDNTRHKMEVVDQGDRFGIGATLRENAKAAVNRYVKDEDLLELGTLRVRVLHTPGHTDNHIALLAEGNLFTGDLLLIGQAGRSDLPGGDPGEQYDSLFKKILRLPDTTRMWPGHDYDNNTSSLLGEEKASNPFLARRTRAEYEVFVAEFFPPMADNDGGNVILQCGTRRVTTDKEAFQDVTAAQLAHMMAENPSLFLLDVREPFELQAFGQIPGVHNIPVRQVTARLEELPQKSEPVVVICQSGSRSYEVARQLTKLGYLRVFNLARGTSDWSRGGHALAREKQHA